jgi:integral membrane protein
MIKRFRWLGYAEGISFLLLLGVAMPLKYWYGLPLAVRIVGSIHGALFIAYAITANQLAQEQKWPGKKLAGAIVAAVLPFGPFVFDKRYLKGA